MLESDRKYALSKQKKRHLFYLGRQFFADSQYPFKGVDKYQVQIIPNVGVLFKVPEEDDEDAS